jgi:hypothetical protein
VNFTGIQSSLSQQGDVIGVGFTVALGLDEKLLMPQQAQEKEPANQTQ